MTPQPPSRRMMVRAGVGTAIGAVVALALVIGLQPPSITAVAEDVPTAVTPGWNPVQPSQEISAVKAANRGAITGVLTDGTGATLAGVNVVLYDALQNQVASSATDGAGRYVIAGINPGQYRVQFAESIDGSNPYVSQWWHNTVGEDGLPEVASTSPANSFAAAGEVSVLAGGTASDVNATLHLGASIAGHIDHSGGQFEAASGYVYIHDANGTWVGTAYTDASGNYTFGGLDAGNYSVKFATSAGTHLGQTWQATSPSASSSAASSATATTLTLHAGEAKTGVNATLQESVSITGTVNALNYTGSRRSTVVAMQLIGTEYVRVATVSPDSKGTYSFLGLEPGTYKVGVEEWTTADGAMTYPAKWWSGAVATGTSRMTAEAAAKAAADAAVSSLTASAPIKLEAGTSATARDLVQSGISNLLALAKPPTLTVKGDPIVGHTLTLAQKSWEPQPVVLDYAWMRNGVVLPSEHGLTYALTPADVGTTVTATVTGSKKGYDRASTSVTVAVRAGTLSGATPTVTGTAGVGHPMTVTPGGWSPTPVAFAYTWLRDGKVIPGATSATYTPVSGDAGSKIAVTVSGSAAGYSSVSRTSAATPISKLWTASPNPTISGAAQVGSKLTATAGAWAPSPSVVKYQWLRGGAAISGATGSSYKPVKLDAGRTITVSVTGSKSGFPTTSRTSGGISITEALTAPPVPKITGTVKVGGTLTATPGTWSPSTVTLTYQWLRGGNAIAGATSSKYTLVAADKGKSVSVTVTGSKRGYTTVSKTSSVVKPG